MVHAVLAGRLARARSNLNRAAQRAWVGLNGQKPQKRDSQWSVIEERRLQTGGTTVGDTHTRGRSGWSWVDEGLGEGQEKEAETTALTGRQESPDNKTTDARVSNSTIHDNRFVAFLRLLLSVSTDQADFVFCASFTVARARRAHSRTPSAPLDSRAHTMGLCFG